MIRKLKKKWTRRKDLEGNIKKDTKPAQKKDK
jgi:hypothetical protein